MSLDMLAQQIAFKLASEIGDREITCRIDDFRTKKDRHGRDILELRLLCDKHGKVVLALSPMFVREFVNRLKSMGIEKISEMMSVCFTWERVEMPKVKESYTTPYPRYLPKEVTPCPDSIAFK